MKGELLSACTWGRLGSTAIRIGRGSSPIDRAIARNDFPARPDDGVASHADNVLASDRETRKSNRISTKVSWTDIPCRDS